MIRYQKPTRIELKKSDVEEFEKKRRDELLAKSEQDAETRVFRLVGGVGNIQQLCPPDQNQKRDEIRRRLGFSPEMVGSDGTAAIHI